MYNNIYINLRDYSETVLTCRGAWLVIASWKGEHQVKHQAGQLHAMNQQLERDR
jgi:hypothetical protein